jgi:hypothetical protein
MTGYRSGIAKPTVAVWLAVVLADAGAALRATNATVLSVLAALGGLAVVGVVAFAVVLASHSHREAPKPVPARRPAGTRRNLTSAVR